MAALRDIAIHWYRRAFGAPAGSDIREQGLDTVLDGNNAVAVSESAIASQLVAGRFAEGPRGLIASATGLALAGRRATASLTGPDMAAAQDLLISAAGKHVPLVLHLVARSASAHGGSAGSGHDTVHLCADSGFFILFAQNVQEAVDFSFIARRVAEDALVPGLVVMDDEQTARAVQDVRLLSPDQSHAFVGSPRETIQTPTAAQKLLFGDTRYRLPAWQDLDDPVLTGAMFDRRSFALGAFAGRPYFDHYVGESLTQSFDRFARLTGRQYNLVSRHGLDNAKIVLLAQGAALETTRFAAECLRKNKRLHAGVLGIHTLRPFPGAAVAEALASAEQVFVLERSDTPLSGEPPLTREVRACMHRVEDSRRPECRPVVYGVGGLPLRVSDIVELCMTAAQRSSEPLYLGAAFDEPTGAFPKREVLLDTLRRAYPNAADLGIRATGDTAGAPQTGSISIAVRRPCEREPGTLVNMAAALLHRIAGGRIRGRASGLREEVSGCCVDWLIHGDESLLDPGDDAGADVTVDLARGAVSVHKSGQTFSVPGVDEGNLPLEVLLGGLFAALGQAGLLDAGKRQILSARRALLDDLDEAQRESIMTSFEKGFGQLAMSDSVPPASTHRVWAGNAPPAVRELGRNDNTLASLPRFWDQTGVLYHEENAGRLTADPYFATGSMPPLSATFNDHSLGRRHLPAFEPSLCTGCGQCWTLCPDSAIGVVAASPSSLIDAGIRQTGAEAVRQVSSKLAARMISGNKANPSPPATFGQMLDDAGAWLMEKAPLPDDRKQAIGDGVRQIVDALGALPVAVTQPFFTDAEANRKDSAELLSIVINPEACKDCGICIRHCKPGALSPREQDAAILADARRLWLAWSGTPDTSSESLERAATHESVGATAAMLLSRYCQFAIAGGDSAEAGSGEKIAVRLALAATEFQRQPIVQRFAKTLLEAAADVNSVIRDTLADTLPVDDLDAISVRLEAAGTARVDLSELYGGTDDSAGSQSIDVRQLQRLIDLSQSITATHEKLVRGIHGLGRARYGLAVSGNTVANWAASFPYNPFQVPTIVDLSGDAAQLAAGLVESHRIETISLARLHRLARLEIEKPDGLDWKREALNHLDWQELTDEERTLCPPLILIGDDDMLAGRGMAQLVRVLSSGLPVKVLLLSALDLDGRPGLGMLALAQRNAYVAQTSFAYADHLGTSVLQALEYDGPALLQIYAPSPSRHGFSTELSAEQSRMATDSRVLPLFRYDPRADGVFGLRIDLDGNPDASSLMPAAVDKRQLTPADWALAQGRFDRHFEPLGDVGGTFMPLHEWLAQDAPSRKGKTPYITSAKSDAEQRYSLSPQLIRACEHHLHDWQTLQELAGIVTPFTERVEARIRAEVAAEHEAELKAQRESSAAELKAIREKTQAEIAGKLRSRLVELATRKRS